jgi:hypothetical protein
LPGLSPSPLLVAGSGSLADVLRMELRSNRRPHRWLDLEARRRPSLGRADTLILIGPPAAAPIPPRLIDAYHRRHRPGRLLLIGDQTLPPLPQPDAEALPLIVETIEVEARAAQIMLRRWPPHLGADPGFGQQPHLLIAGRAPPADALLLHALHLAHYGEAPPLVTLLDAEPADRRNAFETRYPQAGQVGQLHFRPLDDPRLDGTPPVTLAVVCLTDVEQGIDLARALIGEITRVQRASPPVLLETGTRQTGGGIADWDGQLVPVSHRHLALAPAGLLDGRGDALAQAIHEHYCDTTEAQGRDPASSPGGRPWSALASSYRDANRHQADHLWIKLALTDCKAVGAEQVESFAFTPLEIERLAIVEHRRWSADRWLAGWTYAPVRDDDAKHHPELVPFDQLSAPMQDLDRFAVRLLPTLLARLDLGLQRMLIVAIADGTDQAPAALPPPRLIRKLLDRLRSRYPDRSLVICGTLTRAPDRQIARMALDEAEATLMLLCPRPVAETLDAQPDADHRRDLLELIARAERRVPLDGPAALVRWQLERADILVRLAPGPPVPDAGGKQVHIDAAAGRLHWGFEY